MGFNKEQQSAIDASINKNVLVAAGAGSGKTRTLAEKVFTIIDKGEVKPSELLVLTFTDNAAHEMRERIITTFKERVLLTDDFKSFIDSCKTEDVENAIKFIIKNGCILLKKYKVELNNHISTDNKRQPLVMLKNPIITKIFLQSSAAARCKKDWPKLRFTTLDKKSFDTIGIWEV